MALLSNFFLGLVGVVRDYVDSLVKLLDVEVYQISYNERIYLSTLEACLYDSGLIEKEALVDFGIDDFREFVLNHLFEVSFDYYEIGDDFFDALSYFSSETREKIMKEEADFYYLSEGTEKIEQLAYLQHRRKLYYSGMVVANLTSNVTEGVPSAFFILRNCLDNILEDLQLEYSTSLSFINSEVEKSSTILKWNLGVCIIFPLCVLFVVALASLDVRNKMMRFMRGIYFLSADEVSFVGERIKSVKNTFSEESEEIPTLKEFSFMYRLTSNREENDMQKTMSKFKSKKNKGHESQRNRQILSVDKSRSYFRMVQLYLVLLGTFVVSGMLSLVFFLVDKNLTEQTYQKIIIREEVKTYFLYEAQFYSKVMSFIGTNGTSTVLSVPVLQAVQESFARTDHQDFIDEFLLFSEENAKDSFFYQILYKAESSNICELVFNEVPECPGYLEGVFTEGLSTVIQYINNGIRSAFYEFVETSRSNEDLKTALAGSFLNDMMYVYHHVSVPFYSWLIDSLEEELNVDIVKYGPSHISTSLVFAFLLFTTWFVAMLVAQKLIKLDETQIKEPFRLLPMSVFARNKYIRQFIIACSPETLKSHGQGFFDRI